MFAAVRVNITSANDLIPSTVDESICFAPSINGSTLSIKLDKSLPI